MKFGLAIISLTAALILALACGGGDGGNSGAPLVEGEPTPSEGCVRTTLSFSSNPLTESAFREADDALAKAIELAQAGDASGAETAFFSGPHLLTHDIDGQLNLVDKPLAIRLCNEVVVMEMELLGDRDASIIAEQARKIREYLAAASAVLTIEPQ